MSKYDNGLHLSLSHTYTHLSVSLSRYSNIGVHVHSMGRGIQNVVRSEHTATAG